MRSDQFLVFKIIFGLPKIAVLQTIRLYQKLFSPDHGPLRALYPYGYCKFKPTCSQYTYEAVENMGVTRGLILGAVRIMRCNPWNKGGYDPVPVKRMTDADKK